MVGEQGLQSVKPQMAPFGKATFRKEGRVANVKRHIRSVFEPVVLCNLLITAFVVVYIVN